MSERFLGAIWTTNITLRSANCPRAQRSKSSVNLRLERHKLPIPSRCSPRLFLFGGFILQIGKRMRRNILCILAGLLVLSSCSTMKPRENSRTPASLEEEHLTSLLCNGSKLIIHRGAYANPDYTLLKADSDDHCFLYRQRIGGAFLNLSDNVIILSKFSCKEGALFMTKPYGQPERIVPLFGRGDSDRSKVCEALVEGLENYQKQQESYN